MTEFVKVELPDCVDPRLYKLCVTRPDVVIEAVDDERYLKSFRHFARRAWRALEEHDPVWEWYHDALCDHLQAVFEGKIQRLLVCIPPRMSKSTIVSVLWPAWCWLHDPSWRVFASSAVDDVVFRDAVRMHELVDSEWYQQTFAPPWGWHKSQDAKSYYVNSKRGHRISRTVGQKLQGVDGDVLIVDDPLDERDAELGKRPLETHVEWFRDRALERLTSPDQPVVVIMQRLHELDLAGWIIDENKDYGGWSLLILPALMEADEDSGAPLQRSSTALGFVDPRAVGESLSSRLPAEFLKRRKRLNPRMFAAKFQQRPAPAEGAIFKKEWFKYWTKETLPTVWDFKVASWDTTFKGNRKNDWVCGQVWGVRGANVYLLEQVRKKMTFDRVLEEIIGQHHRHPGLRATIVEKSGNGPSVVTALKALIPGIVDISVQGETKEQRAQATLPRWAAGQVYIPHPHQMRWVERHFKPELLHFPSWKNDDQVDAMTLAIIWINQHPCAMPIIFRIGANSR